MAPRAVLLSLLVGILILSQPVLGMVNLEIVPLRDDFAPNENLKGSVRVLFNEYLPGAQARFYIDGQLATDPIPLGNYMQNLSYYIFSPVSFSFKIRGSGTNRYVEYTVQPFGYTISASGTRGSPPEPWSEQTVQFSGNVSAWEGLKSVRDGEDAIFPPADENPEDTVWSVVSTNYPNVETVMRKACGNSSYQGQTTHADGFIRTTLLCTAAECDGGQCWGGNCASNWDKEGTKIYRSTSYRFDDNSLSSQREKFWISDYGKKGGIYRNDIYLPYGSGAIWNGSTGYIEILNYDSQSKYEIVFAPPTGPFVCAFTDISTEQADPWQVDSGITSSQADYRNPYTRTFQRTELPAGPSCPPNTKAITCGLATTHTALEVSDPSNSVTMDSTYNSVAKTLDVTATSDSVGLVEDHTLVIPFTEVIGLRAPAEVNSHTLTVKVMFETQELVQQVLMFNTCVDWDGDGYCVETGDCNDKDFEIHPGAMEKCNGKDDNCNNETDETFTMAGTKLGTPCGIGICTGVWVCSPDGFNVTCSSKYSPGELEEVCGDSVDNDCDGVVDEEYELVEGEQVPACKCKSGATRPCGSDVGECKKGYQICRTGVWSSCTDEIGPKDETCNRKDDDCDGTVDNVNGGQSVLETGCQCYNNGPAKEEICNDIDDDCDGLVDEGIICCEPGETRPCGSDIGTCTKGIQYCDNGRWGDECEGGIKPIVEICYNNLDEDCDGRADEDCTPEKTCNNGFRDLNEEGVDCGGPCRPCRFGEAPSLWITIAGGVVVVIVILGLLAFKGFI